MKKAGFLFVIISIIIIIIIIFIIQRVIVRDRIRWRVIVGIRWRVTIRITVGSRRIIVSCLSFLAQASSCSCFQWAARKRFRAAHFSFFFLLRDPIVHHTVHKLPLLDHRYRKQSKKEEQYTRVSVQSVSGTCNSYKSNE